MQLPILDRRSAGRELAALLDAWRDREDVIVLGLPRGGVPVAYEIAQALGVDLDILIVEKPGEFQGDDGSQRDDEELARRERKYRGGRPRIGLVGKTVILVDDGLATGATMRAAIDRVNQQTPARVLIAVPVAASMALNQFRSLVDECVVLTTPEPLLSISQWYDNFQKTPDEEVRSLLAQAWRGSPADRSAPEPVSNDGVEITPIKKDQWTAFLQSFAAQHQGWLVTLGEVDTRQLQIDPNAAREQMRMEVEGVPLKEVQYDINQNAVLVQVSEDKQSRSVQIGRPICVYRETQQASSKGIRIDSEAGRTTLVEFRVAAMPMELDDLALTE